MEYTKLVVTLVTPVALFYLWKLANLVYRQRSSPYRDLPGPKRKSWIWGSLTEFAWDEDNQEIFDKWILSYGNTFEYKDLMNASNLITVDPMAIGHILANSETYQKSEILRYHLARIFGTGVLVAEGDAHRRQRKTMNPAFGPAQIRALTGIFVEKSLQLRDIWTSELSKDKHSRIDIFTYMGRVTLDIIGLAGFNYDFNSLDVTEKPSELNEAFVTLFTVGTKISVMTILREFIPGLRWIPTERDRTITRARAKMDSIGLELLQTSKAKIAENASQTSVITRDIIDGRDLLSLLVKANMATDVPDTQKLSDQDVLAQIPTFLVAGHETSSSGVTWALFALSQNKSAQTKLRDELLAMETDNPSMDDLNSLQYLDFVIRETLRLHAPVSQTSREATKDDILPLSSPVTDLNGKKHSSIRVRKGDSLIISISLMNMSKDIWGENAADFIPERWESAPENAKSIPGVWSNIMTFIGGQRACIGYRFALIEMKALLFTLVKAFEFELAVPVEDIRKKTNLIQRPFVLSEPTGGNQMPMLLKSFKRD